MVRLMLIFDTMESICLRHVEVIETTRNEVPVINQGRFVQNSKGKPLTISYSTVSDVSAEGYTNTRYEYFIEHEDEIPLGPYNGENRTFRGKIADYVAPRISVGVSRISPTSKRMIFRMPEQYRRQGPSKVGQGAVYKKDFEEILTSPAMILLGYKIFSFDTDSVEDMAMMHVAFNRIDLPLL